MPPIYLDYQASTPLLKPVKAAIVNSMDIIGNPHSSLHLHGRIASEQIENAQEIIGRFLGCEAEQIILRQVQLKQIILPLGRA